MGMLSRLLYFRKFSSDPNQSRQNDAIRFIVHGVTIGTPLRTTAGGLSRLKPLLAQRVKGQLEDPSSEFYVGNLCDCKTNRGQDKTLSEDADREDLNDEREDEFAILGMLELREVEGVSEGVDDEDNPEDDEELEQEQEFGQAHIDVHEEQQGTLPVLDTPMEVDYGSDTDEEDDIYFEQLVERMLFD